MKIYPIIHSVVHNTVVSSVKNTVATSTLWNFIISWGFWSKETTTDYYASLEDGDPYISLTEKE